MVKLRSGQIIFTRTLNSFWAMYEIPEILDEALFGVEAVYHFVALVGVGQSMYQIAEYTSTNNLGTAVLLERVVKHRVKKLIVASSMSVYGEGLYETPDGHPTIRRLAAHGS